jgi:uncharacterized membrane protein YidH (DUF202 family)
MSVTSTELAIQRTKHANQRTYLAYMRTGFGIASISGIFKKKWIMLFGIIMIIGSTLQYIIINNYLQDNQNPSNVYLDNLPIIYVILSLGTLYLQFNK